MENYIHVLKSMAVDTKKAIDRIQHSNPYIESDLLYMVENYVYGSLLLFESQLHTRITKYKYV